MRRLVGSILLLVVWGFFAWLPAHASPPEPKTTNFQTGAHAKEKRVADSSRLSAKDKEVGRQNGDRADDKVDGKQIVFQVPPKK